MKIAICSDIHGDYRLFTPHINPRVDLLLCAGDITNFGVRYPERQELSQATDWLRRWTQYCPVLWVPGNHDIGMGEHSFEIPGVTCILGRSLLFGGLRIGGASLSVCYDMPALKDHWAYMTDDQEVEGQALYADLMALPRLDILVSHSPPYNILDGAGYDLKKKQTAHIGSPSLLRYLEERPPKLVVCGHVHEARGSAWKGETRIINTAREMHVIEV